MVVFVVVLINRQAILDEWTLMTSHSSGNGPLSRMGDMAAWEPWCLNWQKSVTLAVSRKLCVIIMTPQKVGRLVREIPLWIFIWGRWNIIPNFASWEGCYWRKTIRLPRCYGTYPMIFQRFQGDCQTSKENTNLKYPEIWKSIFRIGTSKKESWTFSWWFFLSFK